MRTNVAYLIAKQFLTAALKSRAVLILMFIIACLLAFGASSGMKIYKMQESARLDYEKQVRENWEKMPDKHPHRMAHYGYIAFRPKHSLSFFDFGMESYTGNAVFLEAHKQNTVNFSEASFSTGLLRFGEISMAMVLQILVPLLIFFLGFNAVSSERESSTLKILLSQGAGWSQIIFGKIMGLMSVILILFFPTTILMVIFWFSQYSGQNSMMDVTRLLWIFIAYIVYFGILCTIAITISAISKTSKAALVSLIGVWLIFSIVLPRATQALGNHIHPSPSKIEFETAIEKELIEKGDSHNPDDPYFKSLKDSLLQVYKVDDVQDLPINFSGFQMKEGEKISSEIYNKHLAGLLSTYENQNNVSRMTSFINPYIAIKNISMALSGTDFSSYINFQRQAEDYRYFLAQHMNELQIELVSNKKPEDAEKGHIISNDHWKEMPEFQYVAENPNAVFRNEWISITAILAWMIFLGLLITTLSKRLTVI